MAFYHNHTLAEAIITLRVVTVADTKSALGIGIPSAMNALKVPIGIHDIRVGPGEMVDPEEGLILEFIGSRGV